MKKLLIITLVVGMVIGSFVLPAGADLTPMAWGMPILATSSSLTALQNDAAVLTDNEAASIAFPAAGSGFGFGSAFPSIAQTSLQSQLLNSVSLLNANQNFFFAYPYLSIGGAPIPSMGFF